MTQPGVPRSLDYRRNEVESYVANAHRGVNAVTLSTVPFVGFRDRDQYIQRSEAPSTALHNPTAVFHISAQIGHGETNNRPSSLSDEGSQLPLSFPQAECSCEPSALLVVDQARESRSSLPYVQDTPDTPTLHSHQQPELLSDGTVDNHDSNVPSTATKPLARSISHRGNVISAALVINEPATATSLAHSSDTVGEQLAVIPKRRRIPGAFGTGRRDPYAVVEQFKTDEPIPEIHIAPPEVKKSVWAKVTKLF